MNKKILNTSFEKYDDFWLGELFLDKKTTFEVYEKELPTDSIMRILDRIENEYEKMLKTAVDLLLKLSQLFWDGLEQPEFGFTGFSIGLNQNYDFVDFRMCFHLEDDNFSDFANYMVDIKDFKVIGCRREQL